jgi:hypothetical protein
MSGAVIDMSRARLARLPESTRAAILDELTHPIFGVGTDAEIADQYRVSPVVVRELRAEWRRDLRFHAIVSRAREFAHRLGWDGSLSELILSCIAEAEWLHLRGGMEATRHG